MRRNCLKTGCYLGVMFAFLIVGCTREPMASALLEIKLPILASARVASGEGDAAYVSGKVVLDGKCLYLIDENQEKVFPVFSAPKVSFDQTNKVLHVNGQQFNENDVLVYGDPAQFKLNPAQYEWLQAPDPSCNTSHAVVITAAGHA